MNILEPVAVRFEPKTEKNRTKPDLKTLTAADLGQTSRESKVNITSLETDGNTEYTYLAGNPKRKG